MQAEWMERAAMRLASQASAMEVEQVEQVVVPAAGTGGASSEAVSVASSARKLSSDTIGLSNRTNEHPEGLGRGQGECGGRVHHYQARQRCDWSAPRVRARPARRRGSPLNACTGPARLAPNASRPSCAAATLEREGVQYGFSERHME